jgi:hypothetical protein
MSTGLLLPLLLLAAGGGLPEGRPTAAAEVFHCLFDRSWDADYDGWPAGWTRLSAPGFPQYVRIKLRQEPPPDERTSLGVELDGGAAAVFSPPVKISPLLSYVLEGAVKAENLQHDRAWLSITVLDKNHRKLGTFRSPSLGATKGWQKLRLGPIDPNGNAKLAVLGLHVQPQTEEEDLRASVSFTDIWLGCLPRLALSRQGRWGLVAEGQTPEITCTASGFLDAGAAVDFRLEDRGGRLLAAVRRPLQMRGENDRPAELIRLRPPPPCWIGQAGWQPPLTGPGFYRLKARLAGASAADVGDQFNLAVVTARRAPAHSEFGWTLPRSRLPLAQAQMIELLSQAGVRWVKYPLWLGADGKALDSTAAFRDALETEGIEMVGLLGKGRKVEDEASRGVYPRGYAAADEAAAPSAAEVFAPPVKTWYPALEPTMIRLATQVRWWQLGTDDDNSFVGTAGLAAKIAGVKAALDRMGQDVQVGLGWDWRAALPAAAQPPWRFLTLAAQPPLGAEELAERLAATRGAGAARWVALPPLPKQGYTLSQRADSLVRGMLAAKIHGADAIFCPDPFDPQCGLMEPDGTPGDLLLPWRTTALVLGGAKYVGAVELPGGSANVVFARPGDAVMVLWNPSPQEETLYLGPSLRQVDLWGRVTQPAEHQGGRLVRVDPLPTFLVGISQPLVGWQMAFGMARQQMPAVPAEPQENSFQVKNTFAEAVDVKVRLAAPEGWRLEPKEFSLHLPAGAESRQAFRVTLPLDAPSGRQTLGIDFDIQADRGYCFRAERTIEVGAGEVELAATAALNDRGELEVRQTMVNRGKKPASFRCGLIAPDRCRQAALVLDLDRHPDVQVYCLPKGRELLGKNLWLRAEEVDGPRVFNCRVSVPAAATAQSGQTGATAGLSSSVGQSPTAALPDKPGTVRGTVVARGAVRTE